MRFRRALIHFILLLTTPGYLLQVHAADSQVTAPATPTIVKIPEGLPQLSPDEIMDLMFEIIEGDEEALDAKYTEEEFEGIRALLAYLALEGAGDDPVLIEEVIQDIHEMLQDDGDTLWSISDDGQLILHQSVYYPGDIHFILCSGVFHKAWRGTGTFFKKRWKEVLIAVGTAAAGIAIEQQAQAHNPNPGYSDPFVPPRKNPAPEATQPAMAPPLVRPPPPAPSQTPTSSNSQSPTADSPSEGQTVYWSPSPEPSIALGQPQNTDLMPPTPGSWANRGGGPNVPDLAGFSPYQPLPTRDAFNPTPIPESWLQIGPGSTVFDSNPLMSGFVPNRWKPDVRQEHKSAWDTVADPVDVVTGAFYSDEVDLAIVDVLPVEIRRNYNSQNPFPGELGYGWKLSLSPYLIEHEDKLYAAEEDGTVIVYRYNPDSSRHEVFPEDNPGLFNTSNGKGSPFHAYIQGGVLYGADGSQRIFDGQLLKKWIYPAGDTLIFSYCEQGIRKIESSYGRSCTFSYDQQDRISAISSGGCQTVRYHYNAQGDLVRIVLPNQATITYDYDSLHRIVRELRPENGNLENTYDHEGRVTSQRTPMGPSGEMVTTATFFYEEGKTTVTDAAGFTTTYHITGNQIYKIIDPLGCETLRSWFIDASHWLDPHTGQIVESEEERAWPRSLKATTDKRGLVTYYRYDNRGNPCEIGLLGNDLTGTDEQQIAKQLKYNEHNLCVEEESADHKTVTTYDSTFPYLPSRIGTYCGETLVSEVSFDYYPSGQLRKADRDGVITLWEYNGWGFPKKKTQLTGTEDPDVETSYFRGVQDQGIYINTYKPDGVQEETYDVMGKQVKGRLLSPSRSLLEEVQIDYNLNNQPISRQEAQSSASHEYFPSGLLKASHQALDQGTASTLYQYDARGNRIQETDPLGYSTYQEYDPRCQVIRICKEGSETCFSYEAGGFVETITHTSGGTATRRYTTNGLLREEEDPDGTKRTHVYDQLGRPLREWKEGIYWEITYDDAAHRTIHTHPETQITEIEEFDTGSNLICFTDAAGYRWEKSYDGLDRLKTETTPTGEITTWSYDGDTVRCRRPNGEEHIHRYACGRLVESSVLSPKGELIAHTQVMRDPKTGQETTLSGQDKSITKLNPLGLTASCEQQGARTTFEYDACGNCTAIIDGEGRKTSFTYDAFGHPATKTLPDGTFIDYSYDLAGNLTEMILPNGTIWRASYDLIGRRCLEELTANGESTQVWEYVYENDQLREVKNPLNRIHTYQYDPLGRVIEEVVDGWRRTYAYDARGLLTSAEQYQGGSWVNWLWSSSISSSRVGRTYDASGNLANESVSLGSQVLHEIEQRWERGTRTLKIGSHERTHSYQNGKLISISIPNCQLSYTYSLEGNLIRKTSPLVVSDFTYHPSGLIKSIHTTDGAGHHEEGLGWDRSGKLSDYTTADRALRVEYTPRGMLHSIGKAQFEYDFGGMGTGVCTSLQEYEVVAGGLDSFGRSVTEVGQTPEETIYNSSGQVVSQGDRQFEWDPWGRLLRVITPDFTWEASYDAFGRRLQARFSRGGGKETTTFSYDPEEEFQEIGVTSGEQIVWKLYGPATCDALVGEEVTYPSYNALGQLIRITYKEGEISYESPLSPYGPRAPPEGALPGLPVWHGKSVDPTGLVWLGARYYDPKKGRFLSTDPVGYPACLDLYTYANGDPINFSDLDGRFASQAYQKVKSTAINTWYDPQFQGSLQMVGGAIETGVGAGVSFATGGLGSAVGIPIMAHGMDHLLAGGAMAMSGKPRSTMTSHALQRAGLSPEKAHMMDAGIGMVATMGAAGHLNAVRATTLPVYRAALVTPAIREAPTAANYRTFTKSNLRGTKLVPHPEAQGLHSSYRRSPNGKLQKYETYQSQTNLKNPNAWETLKRYDGPGGFSHWNKVLKEDIPTPHVHDPQCLGGVRAPLPWEIPN